MGKTFIVKSNLAQWDKLYVENGCLKGEWVSNDGKFKRRLLVVPNSLITRVLKSYNEDANGGHKCCQKYVSDSIGHDADRLWWSDAKNVSNVQWLKSLHEVSEIGYSPVTLRCHVRGMQVAK